jgi:hypothetical protein
MDLTTTFTVLTGIGMIAFSVGAFGLLDAYHKRHPHLSRVDWLISLYMFGVLLNVIAYLIYGRWWVSAPLVLMLLPADRAMRMRTHQRQRRAVLETLNQRDTGSDRE